MTEDEMIDDEWSRYTFSNRGLLVLQQCVATKSREIPAPIWVRAAVAIAQMHSSLALMNTLMPPGGKVWYCYDCNRQSDDVREFLTWRCCR